MNEDNFTPMQQQWVRTDLRYLIQIPPKKNKNKNNIDSHLGPNFYYFLGVFLKIIN